VGSGSDRALSNVAKVSLPRQPTERPKPFGLPTMMGKKTQAMMGKIAQAIGENSQC